MDGKEKGPEKAMWFKVQVAVKASQEEAEQIAARLRQDGYRAYVVADENP
ncbi:MAG TPA: SPOR domain-containing protein [Candidatus Fimivivens faecavium]|nr:SPOR domain-containing protein [Candidatus Fimivivens faecavium]